MPNQTEKYNELLNTYGDIRIVNLFLNNPDLSIDVLKQLSFDDTQWLLGVINWKDVADTEVERSNILDLLKAYKNLLLTYADRNVYIFLFNNQRIDFNKFDPRDTGLIWKNVERQTVIDFFATKPVQPQVYADSDISNFFLNNKGIDVTQVDFSSEADHLNWQNVNRDKILPQLINFQKLYHSVSDPNIKLFLVNNFLPDFTQLDFAKEATTSTMNWTGLDQKSLLPVLQQYQVLLQTYTDVNVANFLLKNPTASLSNEEIYNLDWKVLSQYNDGLAVLSQYRSYLQKYSKEVAAFLINNPGQDIVKFLQTNFEDWATLSTYNLDWIGSGPDILQYYQRLLRAYPDTDIANFIYFNPSMDPFLTLKDFDFANMEAIEQLRWENLDRDRIVSKLISYQKILQTYADIDIVNLCYLNRSKNNNAGIDIRNLDFDNPTTLDSLNWYEINEDGLTSDLSQYYRSRMLPQLRKYKSKSGFADISITNFYVDNPTVDLRLLDLESQDTLNSFVWVHSDLSEVLPQLRKYQMLLRQYADADVVLFCFNNSLENIIQVDPGNADGYTWSGVNRDRLIALIIAYKENRNKFACKLLATLLFNNSGMDLEKFKTLNFSGSEQFLTLFTGGLDLDLSMLSGRSVLWGSIYSQLKAYQALLNKYSDISIVDFCFNNCYSDITTLDLNDTTLEWNGLDKQIVKKYQETVKVFEGTSILYLILNNPTFDIRNFDFNNNLSEFWMLNFKGLDDRLKVLDEAERYKTLMNKYMDMDIINIYFHNPNFNISYFDTSSQEAIDNLNWQGVIDQAAALKKIRQYQFLEYRYRFVACIVNFYFNNPEIADLDSDIPELKFKNLDLGNQVLLDQLHWEGVNKDAGERTYVIGQLKADQVIIRKYVDVDVRNFFLNESGIEKNIFAFDFIKQVDALRWRGVNKEKVLPLLINYQSLLKTYTDLNLVNFLFNNTGVDIKSTNLNSADIKWEGVEDSTRNLVVRYKELLQTYSDKDVVTLCINNPDIDDVMLIDFTDQKAIDALNWKGLSKAETPLKIQLFRKLQKSSDVDTFLSENSISDLRNFNFDDRLISDMDWDGIAHRDQTLNDLKRYQELLNTYADSNFCRFVFEYPEVINTIQSKGFTYFDFRKLPAQWMKEDFGIVNACSRYDRIYRNFENIDIVNFFFNNPTLESFNVTFLKDYDFAGNQSTLNWIGKAKDLEILKNRIVSELLRYQDLLNTFLDPNYAIFFFNNPGIDPKVFDFSKGNQVAIDALSWKGVAGKYILEGIRVYQQLLQKYACRYVANFCIQFANPELMDIRRIDLDQPSDFPSWTQSYVKKILPELKKYQYFMQLYADINVVNFFYNNSALFCFAGQTHPALFFGQSAPLLFETDDKLNKNDISNWDQTLGELKRYHDLIYSFNRNSHFRDFLFNNSSLDIFGYNFSYVLSYYSSEAFEKGIAPTENWYWGITNDRTNRYEVVQSLVEYQKLLRKYADKNLVIYLFNYHGDINWIFNNGTTDEQIYQTGQYLCVDGNRVVELAKVYRSLNKKYSSINLIELFLNNPGLDIKELSQYGDKELDQLVWMAVDRKDVLLLATRYEELSSKYTDSDMVYFLLNNPGLDDKTLYSLDKQGFEQLNWQGVLDKEKLLNKLFSFEQLLKLAPVPDIHTFLEDNPGIDFKQLDLSDVTKLSKFKWKDIDPVKALPHLIRYQNLLHTYADLDIVTVFFNNPYLDIVHFDFDLQLPDLSKVQDTKTILSKLKLYQKTRQICSDASITNFLLNNPGVDIFSLGVMTLNDDNLTDLVKEVAKQDKDTFNISTLRNGAAKFAPLKKVDKDRLFLQGADKSKILGCSAQYVFVLNKMAGYKEEDLTSLSDVHFANFINSNPEFESLAVADLKIDNGIKKDYAVRQSEVWWKYKELINLRSFFVKNPYLDIANFNFFDQQKLDSLNWTGTNRSETIEQGMTYQRLLKIVNDVYVAGVLFRNGIKSAQHICTIKEDDFIRECKKWLGDADVARAKNIYTKASDRKTHVKLLYASAHSAVASLHFNNMPINHVGEDLTQYFESISGYEEIFGSQDYCDCEECGSIFGPAAYFVDLMRLIDKGITEVNNISDGLRLLDRRPDLAGLSLTCEKVNTVIPHLQIVNEVLENIISNRFVNLNGSEKEKDVFQTLAATTYPFNLPYHLPLDQIRTYLSQMGTGLEEIITAFDSNQSSLSLALARLGISYELYKFISTPASEKDDASLSLSFGYIKSSELASLSWPDVFRAQTGLSGTQLTDLLHQNLSMEERDPINGFIYQFYINQGFRDSRFVDVMLVATDSENVKESIVNLDNVSLDRIGRFIRLAKKLGWTFEELDWVLTSLKAKELDKDTLVAIAQIKSLVDQYKVPVITLCSFWYDIKTTGKGESGNSLSLFDKVFNPPSLVKNHSGGYHPATDSEIEMFMNPIYKDNWTTWEDGKDVLSGIGIPYDNLSALGRYFWGDNFSLLLLGVSNLSVLYRHAMFSRLTGLSVNNYLTLLTILGKQDSKILSLNDISQILSLVKWMKTSGFNVYELDYILNGNESPYTNSLYSKSNLEQFILSLPALMQSVLLNKDSFYRTDITADLSSSLLKIFTDKEYVSKKGVVMKSLDSIESDIAAGLTLEQISFIIKTVNSKKNEQVKKLTEVISNFFSAETSLITSIIAHEAKARSVQNVVALFMNDIGNDIEVFIKPISKWLLVARKLQFNSEELGAIFSYPEFLEGGSSDKVNDTIFTLDKIKNVWMMKSLIGELQDKKNDLVKYLKEPSMEALFRISGWNEDECRYLCSKFFSGGAAPLMINELYQLKKCFDISKKTHFGVQLLERLKDLVSSPDSSWDEFKKVSATLLSALKSYAGEEQWPDIYKKVNGEVMERKRTALAAYALYRLGQIYSDIDSPRKLYEFLLIDTEMNGSTEISYIKQALNSVQLYMQRCRLNLEQDVAISEKDIPNVWWEWIMNYRIWEANRKVFIYPENYIDPSLRKNKSELFVQLENTLRQGEVNMDNANAAFINYLDEFEKLGKLQYVDAHYCTVNEVNTLLLFARTHTEPYEYYYISKQPGNVWSAWEKINISINAESITPVYAFNKLFVFWVEIKQHQDSDPTSDDTKQKAIIWKATVKYTYHNFSGKWMQPQTLVADQVIRVKSKIDFASSFNEFADDKWSTDWYKVGAYVLSDSVILGADGSDIFKEEKILVHYGPLARIEDSATKRDKSSDPSLSGPFLEFREMLEDAEKRMEAVVKKEGYMPVARTMVLDGNLNTSSFFIDSQESIVFLDDRSATGSSYQPSYDLKNKSLLIKKSTNSVFTNYAAGKSFSLFGMDNDSVALLEKISGHHAEIIPVKNHPHMFVFSDQGESFLFTLGDTENIRPANGKFEMVRYKSIDSESFKNVFNSVINPDRAKVLYGMLASPHLKLIDPKTGFVDLSVLQMTAQTLKEMVDNCKSVVKDKIRKRLVYTLFGQLQEVLQKHNGFDPLTNHKPRLYVYLDEKNVFHIHLGVVIGNNDFTLDGEADFDDFPHVLEVIREKLNEVFHGAGDLTFLKVSGYNDLLDGLKKIEESYLSDQEIKSLNEFITETIDPFYVETIYRGGSIDLGALGGIVNLDQTESCKFESYEAEAVFLILKDNCLSLAFQYNESDASFEKSRYSVERITANAVSPIAHKLFSGGIDDVLSLHSQQVPVDTLRDFGSYKLNEDKIDSHNLPVRFGDQVDFRGAYGNYYWELFFHVPMLIANMLNSNQQFSDAQKWMQYVFNPTIPLPVNKASFISGTINASLSEKIYKRMQDPDLALMSSEEKVADAIVQKILWEDQNVISNDSPTGDILSAVYLDKINIENDKTWKTKFQVNFDKATDELNKYNEQNKDKLYQNDVRLQLEKYQENVRKVQSDLDYANAKLSEHGALLTREEAELDKRKNQANLAQAQRDNDQLLLQNNRERIVQQLSIILNNQYLVKPAARYWQFLPFRNHTLESLSDQIQNTAEIKVYNDDPFDPHAIARLRIGAYEKSIVMQYIDNLLDWGDYMFGQYTWESITTAAMLYTYAWDLLGPRPEKAGVVKKQTELTYNDILNYYKTGDDIPQFFVGLENVIIARYENLSDDNINRSNTNTEDNCNMPFSNMESYFCVPENEQFVGYWDRVEDRLYKIRHGLNLQGISQTLSLFEPPLDPMQLVRAAAAGNNILSVLAQSQGEVPYYRFNVIIERAKNFTQTLTQLGSSLLSALEKNDAERLALLHSTQEIAIQNMSLQIKEQQVTEQKQMLEGLRENLNSAQNRINHYQKLLNENINGLEIAGLTLMSAAIPLQGVANGIKGVTIGGYLTPNIYGLVDGGSNFGEAISIGSQMLDGIASMLNQSATIINTAAQYQRRSEEWQLQQEIAQYEVNNISKQIEAIATRIAIVEQELIIQQKSIENVAEVDDFLRYKFTNADLYQWMIGRISTLYYETYKMASDMAMLAQGAYNFELDRNENFISFDSWDSLRKGLLAGEGLMFALQQMEKAHLTNNTRRLEIEKTISLRQWFPEEFLRFKYGNQEEKGNIGFVLGQKMFDFDYPGHYCRKIKSVSISIPAIVGPYQTINATLTQNSNSIALQANESVVKYLNKLSDEVPRADELRQNWVPGQQIALSKGIDDSGMFTLDFRDERYLPFEGTGAVSGWTFNMPSDTNHINFESISDILVKVYYTAIDGGAGFRQKVKGLYKDPLHLLQAKSINLKQAFPSAWNQMFTSKSGGKISFKVTDDFILPNLDTVSIQEVLVQLNVTSDSDVSITGLTLSASNKEIEIKDNFGKTTDLDPQQAKFNSLWSLTFKDDQWKGIDQEKLLDIVVVIIYKAAPFGQG